MRTISLALILMCSFASPAFSQVFLGGGGTVTAPRPPDCQIGPLTVTSGQGTGVYGITDNRTTACVAWEMFYTAVGSATVSLVGASDVSGAPGAWSGFEPAEESPLSGAQGGHATYTNQIGSWVSVNVTAITTSTTILVFGYRPNMGQVSLYGNGRSMGDGSLGIQPFWQLPSHGMAVTPALFNGVTWDRQVKCPTAVPITIAAAGTSQIVAPSGGKLGRVCGIFLAVSTGGTLQITEGTGSTCGTGTTNISGLMTMPVGMTPMFSADSSLLQANVVGDGICLTSTTAVAAGWAQVEQH